MQNQDLPFQDVQIVSITNNTFEPKLQDKLHDILAYTLMQYAVRISKDSKSKIYAVIENFSLLSLSERQLAASEYEVKISVKFTLLSDDNKTTTMSISNPYPTYFTAIRDIASIIAHKEIAINSALTDISILFLQKLSYEARGISKIK